LPANQQSHHCHHHQSENDSHHSNLPCQSQNSDSIPVEGCVVCEFCLLFNSIDFDAESFQFVEIVSIVDYLEPVLFSGEFFSLFLVRAPPAAIC
jgi:hypothetical protein